MDGVVTMIKVKPGEMAQRGTRIARVFDPSDLQVRFEVPRGHRAEFAVGAAVLVTLDGVDQPLPAKVIDLSADLEAPLQFAVGHRRHRRHRPAARRRPGRRHGQVRLATAAGGAETAGAMIPFTPMSRTPRGAVR
jgi:hypothetical protein